MQGPIALPILAGLLAAALPAAAPSPQASEPALREIGRIHVTTPLCRALLRRASDAVNIAVDNDRRIGLTIAELRKIDLDSSLLAKSRGTAELRREYVALRAFALEGDGEMKKFREDAKAAPNDEQRADLLKFADALGGALSRQKKIAEDMGRYVAFLDAKNPVTDSDHPGGASERDPHAGIKAVANSNYAIVPAPLSDFDKSAQTARDHDPGTASNPFGDGHNPYGDINNLPETLSHSAKRAADQLVIRAQPIDRDEATASERLDPAFKNC